jgi:iron complex transport system ATP-binding protein
VICASEISVGYGGRLVLQGVDLATRPGELVGLIGPNGSGKTTLLRALYASLSPQAGLVTLDDTPVARLTPVQRARRIAVVTQEPAVESPMTVMEMVMLGRSPHRSMLQRYRAEDDFIAAEALRRVGALRLATRVYASLSGGERQRVLIARALAQQVEYLLLDEPTNHLDIRYQHEVLQLVRTTGVTTVAVLHDLNLAARYCQQVVLLHDGGIRAAGTPDDVLTSEILEPVYGVNVRRLRDADGLHLVFRLA